jgi:very-short-patch-repair endonuclease
MRVRHSPHHAKASQLPHYAAQNRAAPTESEARLWSALSAGKLGVAFRRQVVLGGFIVDFLAPRARLVVEVDGSYHAQCVAADARRDSKLGRLGYHVLRIPAALVMGDLQAAVALVRAAVQRPISARGRVRIYREGAHTRATSLYIWKSKR